LQKDKGRGGGATTSGKPTNAILKKKEAIKPGEGAIGCGSLKRSQKAFKTPERQKKGNWASGGKKKMKQTLIVKLEGTGRT